MNNNSPPGVVRYRGLTLVELTVVITILLTLISVLFIGSRAWKRGSDRAICVLSMRTIQVATRSYQNLYGYNYGGRPYAEDGTQDIAVHLLAKGYIDRNLYSQTRGTTKCAAGGTYDCPLPDIFPEQGELYMDCSLSGSDNHAPKSHDNW